MKKALIIGGTGQIGRAVAASLLEAGWHVALGSRQPIIVNAHCEHIAIDCADADGVAQVLAGGFDLVMSCVAFDAGDAETLLRAQDNVGRIVVVSSASVYADDRGRTVDEAADRGFPEYLLPLTEASDTVAAGPANYSTRKVAMETALRSGARVPISILRPCAIHGPFSRHPREWWFVKRFLDGRRSVPLAYGGESRFQTTSVAAIADAVLQAAADELEETVNVIDADSPSVREIGETIMRLMDVDAALVGLPSEDTFPPGAGFTPWSVQHPLVCDARCRPISTYAQSVEPAIDWLLQAVDSGAWESQLTQLAAYPRDLFDYANDDAALHSAQA